MTEAETKANADYLARCLMFPGWEYIEVDIRWYVTLAGATSRVFG